MAFDVAALLKGYNDSTAALLRSAGVGVPFAGGAAAPDETGAAEASTAASEDSPLAKYLTGSQAYSKRHGGHLGLLEQLAISGGRRRSSTSGLSGAASPVSAVADPSGAAVSTYGPDSKRAGQQFTTFDLGDGRRAHVTYTPQGERKVFTFRK